MKKRPKARLWVDPEFKTKLKILATKEDKTILEYTRRISKDDTFPMNHKREKKKFKDVFKI